MLDDNLTLWESESYYLPGSNPIEYEGIIDGFENLVFEGIETLILEHTVRESGNARQQ